MDVNWHSEKVDGPSTWAFLKGALAYAKKHGATLVEAYPVDKPGRSSDNSMWFGAKSMYDGVGFKEVARKAAQAHRAPRNLFDSPQITNIQGPSTLAPLSFLGHPSGLYRLDWVALFSSPERVGKNGRVWVRRRQSRCYSMTIHLSKDLEQFVHDACRTGLYAREDDVIRDALTRLRQACLRRQAQVVGRMPGAPNPLRHPRRSRSPSRKSTSRCSPAVSSPHFPTQPWTSTTTTRTTSRSPSKANRCRKPSFASGPDGRHAYFFGSALSSKLRAGGRHLLGSRHHAPQPLHRDLHRPHHYRRSPVHHRPSPQRKLIPPRQASSLLRLFRQHLVGRYAVRRSRPPCWMTQHAWG